MPLKGLSADLADRASSLNKQQLIVGKKAPAIREKVEPLYVVETAKCRGQRPHVATSTVGVGEEFTK